MTDTLVEWSLGGHIAIIIVALSFYKFVFSDIAKDIIKNGNNVTKKIEGKIFGELSVALKPLLQEERGSTIILLDQWSEESESYTEKTVDLQGTEQYKNALYSYIKSNTNSMLDFRELNRYIDKCLFWKRYLKKSIYVLVGFSLLVVAFEVFCKVKGVCSNNKMVILGLCLLSFVFIVNCFGPLWPLNRYHDNIEDYERKYA